MIFKRVKPKDYNLQFTDLTPREATSRIVIHHTGNPTDDDLSAEQLHRSHQNLGWAGIGYHFVVRKDGSIELGRPVECVGAHAEGFNYTSIGVHVCGNFNLAEPTEAQLNALPMLLADICEAYGLIASDSVVMGHRDLMATACPGNNLYKQLDTIRGNAEWYRNH